jgi:uncharacterized short protein YbdD (DUF466 family)
MLVRRNDGTMERWKAEVFPPSLVPAFLSVLRRIAGMPDYEAYLEHLRCSHPERAIPSQREFYAEFVRSRYDDGPTRCC